MQRFFRLLSWLLMGVAITCFVSILSDAVRIKEAELWIALIGVASLLFMIVIETTICEEPT